MPDIKLTRTDEIFELVFNKTKYTWECLCNICCIIYYTFAIYSLGRMIQIMCVRRTSINSFAALIGSFFHLCGWGSYPHPMLPQPHTKPTGGP